LSDKLTLRTEESNPFRNLIVPMAMQHKGLMHSILCFSSAHLVAKFPQFKERQLYHKDKAINSLRTDRQISKIATGSLAEPIDDAVIAQVLVMCLETICKGDTRGEYRSHMEGARNLLALQQTKHPELARFFMEFFTYHDIANGLTSLDRRYLPLTENFQIPQFIVQRDAGVLLGVVDGLFGYISRITQLRDHIRARKAQNMDPIVDPQSLSWAVQIDIGVRNWTPVQKKGDENYIAAQLYRQCTWVYLYRTIQPSRPDPKIREAVNEGLEFLRQLPPDAATQSILLMPTFLLGCAAFDTDQRPDIKRAFGVIKRYSELGNIEPAKEVVEKVWQMMDRGDEASWDWETIIKNMGYDFLVT
jgi:hypothetical protein